MSAKRIPRPRANKALKTTGSKDLSYMVDLGASARGSRFIRDMETFLPAIILACAVQIIGYLTLYSRAPVDWRSALFVTAMLAMVPIASAATLTAFRRQQAPIIGAIVVGAIFFSFAITILSALRIHMSFSGLAIVLPFSLAIIAAGNISFHRRISARVALVAFGDDHLPLTLLSKGDVAVISDPDADIAAFDTLLIDPDEHHTAEWSSLLSRCYISGLDVVPWTRFLEIRQGRVHIPAFEVSHLVYTPSQMLYARVKRLLDVVAVIVTLPVTLPLASLTALYIFARDGAPVLFIQHRRGFAGKVFRMYKFRTMYKGTGGGSTEAGDKRIIPGCRLIRKLRLDELPQLYNILLGDMSLIGPRPVAEYVARSSIRFEDKYALRNLVLPGITGWAQVNSGYAATTEEEIEKLAYDLYYVKHLSFDLDAQILFRTVKTVLFGTGAR